MPKFCRQCGYPAHKGLCDMATLTDGITVHVSRIDNLDGDVRKRIERGEVKVTNRWIKKKDKKP